MVQRTEEEGGRASSRGLLPLALTVLVVGWVWAPMLGLHLSGEDYVILARLERGLEAAPHVFRPLLGWWLGALHALFGPSGTALHAGSLVLHLVNTSLVFLLARRLSGSAWTAGACAAVFGLGAGLRDSLYWVAAVNRPLSACGALLSLLGLAHLERPAGRRAWVLCALGLAWQFGSNEDFLGTALFAFLWSGWIAWREPAARSRALGILALALGLVVVHALVGRVPGADPSELKTGYVERILSFLESGLPLVPGNASTRSAAIASGLGFPAACGFVLPLLGFAGLVLSGARRAAVFALGAWLASFVPFVLSDAVGYRFYPTQAPVALLFAGGLVGLFARAFPWRAFPPAAFAVLLVLSLQGSRGERVAGLARWHAALEEIRACEAPMRELAREQPESAPVSVNIETTTMGLVYYLWPAIPDPSDVVFCGFLDGATGFVPLAGPPPGTWFGRRCEGSFGVIEPERYFAERARLEPFRLYPRAVVARSLDEARERLTEPALDLTTTAVVEPPAGLALALDERNTDAALDILEPFEVLVPGQKGRMKVRVASGGDVLFAVQDGWLYDPLFRFPPDQTIVSGVRSGRLFALEATTEEGTRLPTFPLNAYGLGALVPAGAHTLEIGFRKLSPDELR